MSISGSATIRGNGNLVFTVYPTAPTNLTASSVASTSAVIGFTPPSALAKVTSYNAYNNGVLLGSYTGTNSITLTGLVANTTYNITMEAISLIGKSPISSSFSFTTLSSSRLLCYYGAEYMNGTLVGNYNGNTVTYDASMIVGGGSYLSSNAKYGTYSFNCAGSAGTGSKTGTNYVYAVPYTLNTMSDNGFSYGFWLYPINNPVYAGWGSLLTIDNILCNMTTSQGGVIPYTFGLNLTNYSGGGNITFYHNPTNGQTGAPTWGSNLAPVSGISNNSWVHVVFVYTSGGAFTIYRNCVSSYSYQTNPAVMNGLKVTGFGPNGINNYAGSSNPTFSFTTSVKIGYAGYGPTNGYIDDFFMYNKALSVAEITSIYNGNILF